MSGYLLKKSKAYATVSTQSQPSLFEPSPTEKLPISGSNAIFGYQSIVDKTGSVGEHHTAIIAKWKKSVDELRKNAITQLSASPQAIVISSGVTKTPFQTLDKFELPEIEPRGWSPIYEAGLLSCTEARKFFELAQKEGRRAELIIFWLSDLVERIFENEDEKEISRKQTDRTRMIEAYKSLQADFKVTVIVVLCGSECDEELAKEIVVKGRVYRLSEIDEAEQFFNFVNQSVISKSRRADIPEPAPSLKPIHSTL